MKHSNPRARRFTARAVGVMASIAFVGVAAGASFELDEHPDLPKAAAPAPVAPVMITSTAAAPAKPMAFAFLDSLVGLSGKLRARFVATGSATLGIPILAQLFGDSALDIPGVHPLMDATRSFSLITMLPFSAKHAGRIGSYHIGNWPHEKHPSSSLEYANPNGFIEVTAQNESTYVSEHFRLSDFLTHDQQDTWPKYLVLNERLVDKLELVIEDLNAHGVHVEHLAVMSGFRTPEYNRQGVGEGGRARDSRHQYGDAADVYVDNNGSGRMNDLNHDGRIDSRDAKVIRDAVDRVEAAHPELVGGVGVYRGNSMHGPFAHVDARGVRARWGRS
ncbi:MAG TPA: D-Ala-D-Ala carboxypeptidase family metallohydrolase [Gemmatimonadaceae bacterium]|nr:D-Ala-D-Ala carboxypeptidase family metallohydrolase [Gemmatimonadaceae bacterium]